MVSQQFSNPTSDLQGQIERITYTNLENGYTVARLKVFGRRDMVTVVGTLMDPVPGEVLKLRGHWDYHPRYGEQFKIIDCEKKVPATEYGIRKYLGSGLIKGIGPKIAERIVNTFGSNTLDVIEDRIDHLGRIDGIGQKRIDMIRRAWQEQKEIRAVMMFLQSHGVGSGYATKIFKQYGNDSIPVVTENPYRLAMDIFGIGFVTADHIAEKLGFDKNSPLRAEAGIVYTLHQLADTGHVFYPLKQLTEKCADMLQISSEIIAVALAGLSTDRKIVVEDLNADPEIGDQAVYLSKYYLCETRIARRLLHLLNEPKNIRSVDEARAIEWVQKRSAIHLTPKQIDAVRSALKSKVLIITGGPGTGKTTIIRSIINIYKAMKARILLAAPTGRATKRMSEASGHDASTIHRLLEFSVAGSGFKKDEKHPLKCDILIIDEASMIDTILMHHLLKAVPEGATLILVGDINQLPSVGAGNVLRDIIDSGTIPVSRLSEIFRQAGKSHIIINAHRVNRGLLPINDKQAHDPDFYFIDQENPEKAVDIILKLVRDRIPSRFGLDPFNDIQVLTPMNKGIVGAINLNRMLQDTLNPAQDAVVRGQKRFRPGDKVMQIRNNYEKEVFNGDIGTIAHIDPDVQQIVISFDGSQIDYTYADLDEVVPAYAISIHKSQGSEYPAVIIPILIQHYVMLQRNLIYTAITRGKHLVVIVGSKKAMAIGVKNNTPQKRYTWLRHRLI